MDEWTMLGATAVPREEALAQRAKYFPNVHFRTIDDLFESSKVVKIV